MLSSYILLPIASRCVCVCGRCVFMVGVCLWSVCVCGQCVFVVGVCLWTVCVCGRCVCLGVYVAQVGVCMCVFGRVLVVGNASMIDLLLYEIGNE